MSWNPKPADLDITFERSRRSPPPPPVSRSRASASVESPREDQQSWFPWWLLLFCTLMVTAGCVQPVVVPDRVEPSPNVVITVEIITVESAAETCIRDYANESANVFDLLAKNLRAGAYVSQHQFADDMETRLKAVRRSSFVGLKDAWDGKKSEIPPAAEPDQGRVYQPQEWDREADAVKCDKTAVGFRKAVAK